MMDCYLQGKRFYARDWVFQKLLNCLNSKSRESSGVLILGSAGTGKTAICAEIVQPTNGVLSAPQLSLSERILAVHFCQSHLAKSLTPGTFVSSLAKQVLSHALLAPSLDQILATHPAIDKLKDETFCARYPVECAHALSQILNLIPPPSESFLLLVDSIHEVSSRPPKPPPGEPPSSSPPNPRQTISIASLLARLVPVLPVWVLVVCTARRLFGSFRRIVLDDLKKASVVRDTQSYILKRIDNDADLYELLIQRPETAELLNQLHIKSAGCLLYLEKILNGLVDGLLKLNELADIPGTLNGLYLWLCQRIYSKKQFEQVRPALNILLASRRPLTLAELKAAWVARNLSSNPALFDQVIMKLLNRVLIPLPAVAAPEPEQNQQLLAVNQSSTPVILFHNSFAEWLRDVKHCTQRYLCSYPDGQHSLAMYYAGKAGKLDTEEIVHFCQCLDQGLVGKGPEPNSLQQWLLSSGVDPAVYTIPVLEEIPQAFRALFPQRALDDAAHAQALETLSALSLIRAANAKEAPTPFPSDTLDGRTSQMSSTYSSSSAGMAESTLGTLIQAAREGWDTRIRAMLCPSGPVSGFGGLNPNCTDSEGWSPLRGAAWAGHVTTVELLLACGAQVDFCDETGRTALRAAAWAGHEGIVTLLLKHGSDINKRDAQGRTALMAAANMGHVDIVRILLAKGAEPDLVDSEGRSALALAILGCTGLDSMPTEEFSALLQVLLDASPSPEKMVNSSDNSGASLLLNLAFEGTPSACDILISHGADPDLCSQNQDGWYPVHAAASSGNRHVLDLLLERGASIDAIDHEGRTALSLAAAYGKPDMVRYLLEKGLDELHRDNHGWIPLHLATLEDRPSVIKALLIHNEATVAEVDREGRHPLILAAEEGAIEAAQALLEFNPPVNLASLAGHSPLRVACLTKNRPMAELLMTGGADPDLVDLDGRSTLFIMILQKIPQFAEFLLSHGASPDAKDLMGRTPLHVAAYLGSSDLVDMLLKWGANVNALDQAKRTPLITATWQGELNVCKLLLDYSAKPDLPCKEGATPLHVAAQTGREDIVRVLLQYSADHTILDSFGRTPAAIADLIGHPAIVTLLTSRETAQTAVSQTSTQDSSGIGSATGYSTVESPFRTVANGAARVEPSDKAKEPIDHIVPGAAAVTATKQHSASPNKERFNTHSSSLSNYTLSSSASLGSNPDQVVPMDGSAIFTLSLLERSQSQRKAREALASAAQLSRSAHSEPNGAASPNSAYRSRPRIVTNPRCRRKASPANPDAEPDFRTS